MRVSEAAGLRSKDVDLTIHSLRRQAATRWLRHGLSVPEIQLLLGHESPQTTARYLNVELARIQQHIAQLPPIVGEAVPFQEDQVPGVVQRQAAGRALNIEILDTLLEVQGLGGTIAKTS
ncbi:MAG: site-specific integrase [Armatimonadetes bacterium]|nr:site-specific integrase [Armatimonadota bacterium]